MSKGRKWYKKEEYNQPLEPFDPGDGSLIEVVKAPTEKHPNAVKITRVWPDGHVTTVHKVPPTQWMHAQYLDIQGERTVAPDRSKAADFEKSLQEGTYRPPYLQLAAVPGNKIGDNFDVATNQYFETRARFNKYYEENKLQKVSANDSTIPTNGCGGGYAGSAEQFDPAKPPPVPREFQGVKFYYGNNSN